MQMDIEQSIQKPIWQGQEHSQEEYNHGNLQQKEELYLETDAIGVGLGVSLMQVRDGIKFSKNEVSDNAVMQPVTFTSKNQTVAETHYSN